MNKTVDMKALLKSWNLSELQQHLQDEDISIEELQLMKPHHIAELLRDYKLGIRIRFEHHFEAWRRSLNKPLQSTASCYVPRSDQAAQHAVVQPCALKTCSVATSTESLLTVDVATNTALERAHSATQTKSGAQASQPVAQLRDCSSPCSSSPMPSPGEASAHLLELIDYKALSNEIPLESNSKSCTSNESSLTLQHILENSGPKGLSILEYYRLHRELTKSHRTMLIHLVVNYFEFNNYHLSLNMSHNLENQALELFPGEKLEYYRTEKRGKMYVKFCNMKRYRSNKAVKRSLDSKSGAIVTPSEKRSLHSIEFSEVPMDDMDMSWQRSLEGWPEQQPNPDVQVKTEHMSDDGY